MLSVIQVEPRTKDCVEQENVRYVSFGEDSVSKY